MGSHEAEQLDVGNSSHNNNHAYKVGRQAIECLGQGFDVTADFRLRYCKPLGSKGSLIKLDSGQYQKVKLPGGIVYDVPACVKYDKGERIRFTSDVMQFSQMAEFFNHHSSIEGKIPLGFFNAVYQLSGLWQTDATLVKQLAFDGCFITLYSMKLSRNLVLKDEVLAEVPSTWEPEALSRFITKYGTHIVVGVRVGGQYVLYLKVNQSSLLSSTEIHEKLKRLGDEIFNDSSSSNVLFSRERNNQAPYTQTAVIHSAQPPIVTKDFIIIPSKRGGNSHAETYKDWQLSVNSNPDIISLAFVPITSLMNGLPGKGFLNHAINLYLRYKPKIEELQYFLEFQIPRQWAPVYGELPLGPPRTQAPSACMRFSFMGPILYVNTSQVWVCKKPVTGVRLYLEGRKNNRLAIHLQHLSNMPQAVLQCMGGEEPSIWHGTVDLIDRVDRYLEPVQWKRFSQVCTAPVRYNPEWLESDQRKGGVFIVTGAQLLVKGSGFKKVLHLRLQFTQIPCATIQKSTWEQPSNLTQKSTFFSIISAPFSTTATAKKAAEKSPPPVMVNSGVFLGSPPSPVQIPRLLKFVDTTELTKGPHDLPGHWLVTAAKLCLEQGKISLRVKYSFLNYQEFD